MTTESQPAPTINVQGTTDYRVELTRESFSWWKSLGLPAQISMLVCAAMIGLATLGATHAIQTYEKISAETAKSYEKIHAEHRASYEKLTKDHGQELIRIQTESERHFAAMEAKHQADFDRAINTISETVRRLEAVAMSQSGLVQTLVDKLIARETMK